MKHYVHFSDEGEQSFFSRTDADPEPGGEGVIQVPRPPGDGEKWSRKLDGFVLDKKARQELVLPSTHVEMARLQKRLEAIIIKTGQTLTEGLLCAEAVERGITQAEMADVVIARAQEFTAQEAERQKLSLEDETATPVDEAPPGG